MKKFPGNEIEKALRDWYKSKTSSPLKRKRLKIPGSIFDIQPEVSSQETTQIVVVIEPLIGFKVKTGEIIKPGGYRSVEEFVSYTLKSLERVYNNRYRIASKAVPRHGGISANVR
jgi:hypothetical protein